MDLHCGQIQGFFDIPVDNLFAKPIFASYMEKVMPADVKKNLLILAPDFGASRMARSYANVLGNCPIAIAEKIHDDRPKQPKQKKKVMNIIGDVKDKDVLILDDMADTAGTLCEAAEETNKRGALSIRAMCIHPVLSGPAIEKIQASPISKLFVSDTIPLPPEKRIDKIQVVSVTPLFAEAIIRTHRNESVEALFI